MSEYQLKISKKTHGTYISVLQDGKPIEPMEDLYATKGEALRVGKLLEQANDASRVRSELAALMQKQGLQQQLDDVAKKLVKLDESGFGQWMSYLLEAMEDEGCEETLQHIEDILQDRFSKGRW